MQGRRTHEKIDGCLFAFVIVILLRIDDRLSAFVIDITRGPPQKMPEAILGHRLIALHATFRHHKH